MKFSTMNWIQAALVALLLLPLSSQSVVYEDDLDIPYFPDEFGYCTLEEWELTNSCACTVQTTWLLAKTYDYCMFEPEIEVDEYGCGARLAVMFDQGCANSVMIDTFGKCEETTTIFEPCQGGLLGLSVECNECVYWDQAEW